MKPSAARAEEALWVLERMRGCPDAPPPSHACWLALTRSLCAAGRIDDGRFVHIPCQHTLLTKFLTHPVDTLCNTDPNPNPPYPNSHSRQYAYSN